MTKKNRREKMLFVPDTFEEAEKADTVALEADGIMEAASHFVESSNEPIETTTEYYCTVCHDVFTASDLGKNKDNCPTCNETECIMER
jgi:hypothetical protein